jgi:hypothetical protein
MPSEEFQTIFRRDLDRLPGLAHDDWIPQGDAGRRRRRQGVVTMVVTVAMAAIIVGVGLRGVRNDVGKVGPDSVRPTYIVTAPDAAPPPGTQVTSGNALTGAPSCPGSQTPWLVVPFLAGGTSGPQGGATPEAAFRVARSNATAFTMYLWSEREPIQDNDPRIRLSTSIWIVAGDETFLVVAHSFGTSNDANSTGWYAYAARFAGCIAGAAGPTGLPTR